MGWMVTTAVCIIMRTCARTCAVYVPPWLNTPRTIPAIHTSINAGIRTTTYGQGTLGYTLMFYKYAEYLQP
jgi:hypothetical protein